MPFELPISIIARLAGTAFPPVLLVLKAPTLNKVMAMVTPETAKVMEEGTPKKHMETGE